MSMGWQCPRCSRCYSPSTSQCASCAPVEPAPVEAQRFIAWPFTVSPAFCTHPMTHVDALGTVRCSSCGSAVGAPYTVTWKWADVTTGTGTSMYSLPPGTVVSSSTVTHCQHGRSVGIGACHECQPSFTSIGGAS